MAKAIMIQGTMSNAGKSIIAGGLCRIFRQDGYRVAPFKAQNMALNSFITSDGFEMGRAQAMQAEAAMIDPDVRMNPILLKPSSDIGSQVIVNGEVIGNMSAREYYRNKLKYVPNIMEAYNSLAAENDIIVIEGAGSPAEINLKKDDIVNMGMAKLAKSPVILAGDIDRGGVFAQLIGTVMLLDEDEREYIKGLIVNKFRGDKSILQSGLDIIEEKSGKPVIGVIPYVNVDIDEEDSLSERFSKTNAPGIVDIAVIRTPRISNFTDFTPFECVDGVSLRYVSSAAALGEPDLIIIPGTKNTIEDLLWIRSNGIEMKILRHAAKNKPVIGICGGYQMLGERLTDPYGTEHMGSVRGMGLLPVETVFEHEKTRTRVKGTVYGAQGIFSSLNGASFEGYEIHMGRSEITDVSRPFSELYDSVSGMKKSDGICRGNVYGTYVHGIFDSRDIINNIVSALLKEKGLEGAEISAPDMRVYKEEQYNKLADAVRKNIDMEKIYQILEEGVI